MGFAVAQAAQKAGAEVVLVSGPVSIPTPVGVRRVNAESAVDMLNAVMKEVGNADVFISTAAVADYKPAHPADQKIKKASDRMDLEMARTTDILADRRRQRRAPAAGRRLRGRDGERGAERARQAAEEEPGHDRRERSGRRQGVRV